MVIATLPTFTSGDSVRQGIRIFNHPLIHAVRYNTGGDSPLSPAEILNTLSIEAKRFNKKVYIDLEGRQVRVAHWTPFQRGSVVLNKDFEIELPGRIHFRGLGWFDITNAQPQERKIYFNSPDQLSPNYYLGESQSVHITAKKFETKKYLDNNDFKYIRAAINAGIATFMLSFVETGRDVYEFYAAYNDCNRSDTLLEPEVILKIESKTGVEFAKKTNIFMNSKTRLMAARDDLFLAYNNCKGEFLKALKIIIKKDPEAVLASKIMSGPEHGQDITFGDMADLILMTKMGYKNYMFSDEITKYFDWAMANWQNTMLPLTLRGIKG